MPTYLMLSRLTEKGVQTLNANPARLREVNRDVEELGARVLHQWAALGEYDFVNVVEAPDDAHDREALGQARRAGERPVLDAAARPGRRVADVTRELVGRGFASPGRAKPGPYEARRKPVGRGWTSSGLVGRPGRGPPSL